MKSVVVIVVMLLFISFSARSEDLKATIQDIIHLAQSNVSDETIITYLATREITFVVGAKEILELKNAGVSENIIRYLLERVAPEESGTYGQPDDYYGSYSYGASINTCYGGSFFFSFYNYQGFSYPHRSIAQNYFRMNGRTYFRHNGHFHQDDTHQFASFPQSAPEKAFQHKNTSSPHQTWGSKKLSTSGNNTVSKWGSNSRNQQPRSRSYGSFKNGRSKSGNSWGTKGRTNNSPSQ